MDSSKPQSPAQEAAAPPRKLSRRSVMQAGLKAGPVLMSLPTVPAWAAVNQSVNSSNFCDFEQNQQAGSCIDANQASADANEFADPFAPPGQGQGKDKDDKKKPKQGVFLDSGNWLDD